ncbi:MAG: RagB/SusD family nutrient uptake outer membrane protein [Cytophagales bacterium]|nr:RagB/SusD family nutrient uptake outer membrane protein [Cytophagales bacterium]
MKKLLTILSIFTFTACTDLDITPRNGAVESVAFATFDGYTAYLAKIYGALSLTGNQGPAGDPDLTLGGDEGFSSYLRVFWKMQQLPTEESVISWVDPGIQELHLHGWAADDPWSLRLYTRIFFNISLANDFLRVSESPTAPLTDAELTTLEEYRAEARFLRALSYWHALDIFRNIALTTTISSELPFQSTPLEVFDFIATELSDIEGSIPGAGQNEYGRADAAAVWMLQAKLFLNASVYIGSDQSAEAIVACEKIINSGAFSLAPNYNELFMGDNHLRTDEIIFPIIHDGNVSQSWGGTTFLVRASIGGAMQDNLDASGNEIEDEALTNYGVPSGWNGLRTTSGLVNKFDANDSRGMFFSEGQSLEIQDLSVFEEGYAVEKWSNIEASTGERAPGIDHVGTDFPMFRLADAYLMLAEAEVRNTGSASAASVARINELRQRAFGDNSGDVAASEITLDFLLEERARELYWEGHRRTDLIRFGAFSSGTYLWPWKGGVAEGASISDHLRIFPIPSTDLIVNPNLNQNPGY